MAVMRSEHVAIMTAISDSPAFRGLPTRLERILNRTWWVCQTNTLALFRW